MNLYIHSPILLPDLVDRDTFTFTFTFTYMALYPRINLSSLSPLLEPQTQRTSHQIDVRANMNTFCPFYEEIPAYGIRNLFKQNTSSISGIIDGYPCILLLF
jgi:hypothetical protein